MPNISQQPNTKDADRSAAALSFATMVSEGLIPKQPMQEEQNPMQIGEESVQEAPQTPETAPEEPEEVDKTDEFEAKLDVLSQDVTSVKEMLQQLLNEKTGDNT